MPDNYIVREKYTGLVEVDGQLVPARGQVTEDELVQIEPEDNGAVRNGGGKRGGKLKNDRAYVVGEHGPC